MDEIWNIGIFMQIAIIENIRKIAENIYVSQFEKYKVESLVERLIDKKNKNEQKYKMFKEYKKIKTDLFDFKYPFVEYLSYKLKKYGRKTEGYLKILEDEVEKTGATVSEVIKREHFDIAISKISIGNSITSLKKLQRINFLEIFEKINKVEEILRADPVKVYEKMDFKTKEHYRNIIKDISKKTKVSEMYIAKKILELATKAYEAKGYCKKAHIGYYLQNENINLLLEEIQSKEKKVINENKKAKIYISSIAILTTLICSIFAGFYPQKSINMWIRISTFLILLIPVSEFVVQLIQYFLSKFVKPKLIPKLDFENRYTKRRSDFCNYSNNSRF